MRQIHLLIYLFSIVFSASSSFLSAQNDTSSTKKYCTLKVSCSSPFKILSIGYDYQATNTLSVNNETTPSALLNNTLGGNEKSNINYNQGLRVAANVPVLTKKRCMVILGLSYLENKYNFSDATPLAPLPKNLNDNGLRSMGASYAIFIPLNATCFLLNQSNFDLSGDYNFSQFQDLSTTKISSALLIGYKPHERRQIAIGLSRTYRGGELAYLPVLLYNYTFPNRKWGIESLLPARLAVRYTVNPKNILLCGFMSEGNSYYLGNLMKNNPGIAYKQLELKRSELRVRVVYERSLYKFIWLSLQAGYRINTKFNIDDGDVYKGFSTKTYLMENKLTSPFYATIAINLVAP